MQYFGYKNENVSENTKSANAEDDSLGQDYQKMELGVKIEQGFENNEKEIGMKLLNKEDLREILISV